jgi:hypothetical protein
MSSVPGYVIASADEAHDTALRALRPDQVLELTAAVDHAPRGD